MSNTHTPRYDRQSSREKDPSLFTSGKVIGAAVVASMVGLVGYGAINHIKAEQPLMEAKVQMGIANHPRHVIHLGDVVHETDADGDYIYANLESIAVSAKRNNPELAGVDKRDLVAFLKEQNGIGKEVEDLSLGRAVEFPAEWEIGKPVLASGDSADKG